jgi:iron complex transport system ATP-binding protein
MDHFEKKENNCGEIMTVLLNTQNLAIGYKSNKIEKVLASDINLNLKSGQLVALIGQNGVGKSTLIRTLIGLQPPLNGKIQLAGKELKHYKPNDLARIISLVLTDTVQSAGLTVMELVAMGRAPYTSWNGQLSAKDWEKVCWAIEKTRINYIENKYLHELSDGQLQKAMIARAIAQDGELIILDEPTAHLDLNNRVEIMTLLKELTTTTNKAILVATHELQLTLQLADYLWLSNFNMPIVAGVPEDLALNGAIEKTFFFEKFDYDIITGKATLTNSKRRSITIGNGDPKWKYWTENALNRNGYYHQELAPISIEQSQPQHWEVIFDNKNITANSIEELLEILNSFEDKKSH